jgi:hypothetical protein
MPGRFDICKQKHSKFQELSDLDQSRKNILNICQSYIPVIIENACVVIPGMPCMNPQRSRELENMLFQVD